MIPAPGRNRFDPGRSRPGKALHNHRRRWSDRVLMSPSDRAATPENKRIGPAGAAGWVRRGEPIRPDPRWIPREMVVGAGVMDLL